MIGEAEAFLFRTAGLSYGRSGEIAGRDIVPPCFDRICHPGLRGHPMTFRSGILFVLVIAGLIPSTMALAAQPPAMPPNTIDCKDWKHLRDGSWQAAANAKPFDGGTVTHMQGQDEAITRHAI